MTQNLDQLWEIYSARMEALMEQLPAMEQLSLLHDRMKTAQQAIEESAQLQMLLNEQEHMRQEAEKYQEAGNQGLSVYIQNQMGYRQGPIRERKAKLAQLLEHGSFSGVAEAETLLSGAAQSVDTIEKKILAFQREYAQVLEKCREIDTQLRKTGEQNPNARDH